MISFVRIIYMKDRLSTEHELTAIAEASSYSALYWQVEFLALHHPRSQDAISRTLINAITTGQGLTWYNRSRKSRNTILSARFPLSTELGLHIPERNIDKTNSVYRVLCIYQGRTDNGS